MQNSTIKLKHGLCKGDRCKDKTDQQPFAHNKLELCALCNKHRLAEDKKKGGNATLSKPRSMGMPKQSKKQRERALKYAKVREPYLAEHQICEVRGCNRKSTNVHHKKGRIGELLFDTEFFMACCHICHPNKIHNNVAWAKENGYILPK